MDQKVSKVFSLLPDNKQIFATYAVFETVQQVPTPIRNQYFDRHVHQIAKMFAQAIYKNTDIEDINKDDIVIDFMDWLESGDMKFKMKIENRAIAQTTTQNIPQPKPVQPQIQVNNHTHQKIPLSNQNTPKLSPRPQSKQAPYLNLQTPVQNLQPKVQSHYQQNLQPQGRPNVVKYTSKQPSQHSSYTSYTDNKTNNTPTKGIQPNVQQNVHQNTQGTQNEAYRQMLKKQYQKQNFGWVDSLSKCLTHPQKRFYLMPEMLPKKKF